MRLLRLSLLLAAALFPGACRDKTELQPAAAQVLPESDEMWVSFPPGVTVEDVMPVIDEGLKTYGKGPTMTRFVVLRAGDRHEASYRAEQFHVVIGAGIEWPAGSMRVQRKWQVSGMVDGRNEKPQTMGIGVVVEPGAATPYSERVIAAAHTFLAALTRRVPVHPDCILAMEEIAYTRHHDADAAERALAAGARAGIAPPPIDGHLTILSQGKRIEVAYERRDDRATGIAVGMMFRRKFDGEDRGMFFVYAHRSYRKFWMRNCRIRIDLAYLYQGKISQIETMEPQWGATADEMKYYPSRAAIKYALEMPAGWFQAKGIQVGDTIELE